MRSMVHVESVANIEPIHNADAIEVATILGWKVVVKKGEFEVGDKVAFFEIDSWVPLVVAPFLQRERVREYNGVKGERLRTVRLRGQISQGLILPLPYDLETLEDGTDITEAYNVQKYERPENSACMGGLTRGNFPPELRKTDQERIQNVYGRILQMIERGDLVDEWCVQEKLEGSSMQVAKIGSDVHVLSRNLSLKLDQEGNAFVNTANRYGLVDAFRKMETNANAISIQGELIGTGIQGNIYKLDNHQYRVFDIFVDGRYLSVPEIIKFIDTLKDHDVNIDMVPMQSSVLRGVFKSSVDDILKMAEIKSHLNPKQDAEGLVFKNLRNPEITFKAISNRYLLKNDN